MTTPARLVVIGLGAMCLWAANADRGAAEGITFTCTPGPCSGWHRTDVMLRWTVDFTAPYQTDGCDTALFHDEGFHSATCRASNGPNLIGQATATVRIDRVAPKMTGAAPSVPPNPAGWITAPTTVGFTGVDTGSSGVTVSGLDTCSRVAYAGPDSPTASVMGTCRDVAGNESASTPFTFAYDATPPLLSPPTADIGDGMLRVRWSGSDPVSITRTPGRSGKATSEVFRGLGRAYVDGSAINGVAYRYTVTSTDPAGNVVARDVSAVASRRVLGPAKGTTITGPTTISWSEINGASYYNVQVFRGKRKVLSTWPKAPAFRLRRSWRYLGRTQRLSDGPYSVYVWPGFGPLRQQRYGRIIGVTSFRKGAPG